MLSGALAKDRAATSAETSAGRIGGWALAAHLGQPG